MQHIQSFIDFQWMFSAKLLSSAECRGKMLKMDSDYFSANKSPEEPSPSTHLPQISQRNRHFSVIKSRLGIVFITISFMPVKPFIAKQATFHLSRNPGGPRLFFSCSEYPSFTSAFQKLA
jgi:hypothetical protein